MRGFISLDDYDKYKKQKNELKPYYEKIKKRFHCKNTEFECLTKILDEIEKNKHTHTKFTAYHLSKDSKNWYRNLM